MYPDLGKSLSLESEKYACRLRRECFLTGIRSGIRFRMDCSFLTNILCRSASNALILVYDGRCDFAALVCGFLVSHMADIHLYNKLIIAKFTTSSESPSTRQQTMSVSISAIQAIGQLET